MRWTIVAVGRLKERHWREAVDEYLKRMRPYRAVQVIELPDERADAGESPAQIVLAAEREGDRILSHIKPQATVVALWEQGEQISSERLAQRLLVLEQSGGGELVFVLGGSYGLAPKVLARAAWHLGLSRMTLPHQMARVVLCEQLYRAERIRRQEPYHK
ncbi:MAG: 23S rRNA (pseudouridine(1915)-N(3))-methyltransferase RlmH [Candidatus Sericytochromatia bacterium]|nr:23S rRNA (pseudouridine(1915)-N(3))-methyltransferase RlmH [Candidatus Sericytochromatia bacterium]